MTDSVKAPVSSGDTKVPAETALSPGAPALPYAPEVGMQRVGTVPVTQPPLPTASAPYMNISNPSVTNVSTMVNVGGPNILISQRKQNVPLILRILWFCFVGFWLSGVFILLGYVFVATILLAPLGFWFLNRIPQAQTLRMRNTEYKVVARDGYTELSESTVQQIPWYYRALYFPVGLILGLVWLSAAWLISLLVITLPLSIWMIDRAPAVISLQRH